MLFQSNLVGRGRGQNWLRRARGRLYQHLLSKLTDSEQIATQIVFDASKSTAPRLSDDELIAEGNPMHVVFAAEYREADDLLEKIIREHPHPKTLLVVSSDHRVQKRGKAKRTQVMDSDAFLDWLDRRPSPIETAIESDTTLNAEEKLAAEEVDYWLREFNKDSPE